MNGLERRLRRHGWEVSTAAEDGTALGGTVDAKTYVLASARRCTLVGGAVGSSPTDFLLSLPRAEAGTRAIINSLTMSSTQAKEIAQAAARQGLSYLDALPVGTVRDVEEGRDFVLAGGKNVVFERAKPLLEAIGTSVFHVSEEPGPAHVMQQINGSVFATLLAVTCEAFVVGAKAGLDPLTMTKILGIETGRNAASARIIPEQVATRRFDYGKLIGEARQDLALLSDEARRLGVTPWILDKVRLLYGLAAELGDDGDDITRLAVHYEKWASAEIKLPNPATSTDKCSTSV